jgi:amino acid transporter
MSETAIRARVPAPSLAMHDQHAAQTPTDSTAAVPDGPGDSVPSVKPPALQRHFGLLQATALNVTMIVGAGVFIMIPLMLGKLPGIYALLGWVGAGVLMLFDGLVWSELGATLPGSGGTYLYLLESYGRRRWGRLMAFLFIWQFLISGPLEIGSGLIAIGQFSTALSPHWKAFNTDHTVSWQFAEFEEKALTVTVGPAQGLGLAMGVVILLLLYRRITTLGTLTVTFWLGVLGVIAWILIDGGLHFDPALAFDDGGTGGHLPHDLWSNLGKAMILAMYAYLGYYNVCYIGDEVRDPGRTIPRSILLSAVLVCVLFAGLHLAMLGTVPWRVALKADNLPADFMAALHGPDSWPVVVVTLLLIWACVGSAFAGLLGYSRIPYGAARYGHFFSVMGRVHPRLRIPHVSLLAVGGLSLFWTFFNLEDVVNALITTRIIEQFIAQIVGVVLLRRRDPGRPRPYRMWLYPLPCGLALAGWVYLYVSAGWSFIVLGVATLAAGLVAFLVWTWRLHTWPFAAVSAPSGADGR